MESILDIQKKVNQSFVKACCNNDLDKIKFLFSQEPNPDINTSDGQGMYWLSYNNNLEAVQYLLTSCEITPHPDIHINNNWALRIAATKGHLPLFKYLVKHGANINAIKKYNCEKKVYQWLKDYQNVLQEKENFLPINNKNQYKQKFL